MATTKVTYSLDVETIAALEDTAGRLHQPKSRVVRDAIREYAAKADRLTSDERSYLLRALDVALNRVPERPLEEVETELEELREARRTGGRGALQTS